MIKISVIMNYKISNNVYNIEKIKKKYKTQEVLLPKEASIEDRIAIWKKKENAIRAEVIKVLEEHFREAYIDYDKSKILDNKKDDHKKMRAKGMLLNKIRFLWLKKL